MEMIEDYMNRILEYRRRLEVLKIKLEEAQTMELKNYYRQIIGETGFLIIQNHAAVLTYYRKYYTSLDTSTLFEVNQLHSKCIAIFREFF